MYRTQIQIREDQSKKLKEMAAEYNVSVAELVRQSIDLLIESNHELTQAEKRKRAESIVGIYKSDVTDLSTNHDHYLAEIYGEVGT
jgi:hypothetical protein